MISFETFPVPLLTPPHHLAQAFRLDANSWRRERKAGAKLTFMLRSRLARGS